MSFESIAIESSLTHPYLNETSFLAQIADLQFSACQFLPVQSQLPCKADQKCTVSWNWGGGAPGGKVAETKEHGEIAIQSKRGNTIKKHAEPGNPAVHIERSGNDVVKRASELNVEEKASTSSSKKREHKDGKDDEGDGPVTENAQGKDVKKQKTEKKSTKTDKKNTKAAEEKEKKEEGKKDEEATKKDTNGDAAQKKKAPGRPKGTASGGAKAKKEPKPRSAEGIGSRTRSRA